MSDAYAVAQPVRALSVSICMSVGYMHILHTDEERDWSCHAVCVRCTLSIAIAFRMSDMCCMQACMHDLLFIC